MLCHVASHSLSLGNHVGCAADPRAEGYVVLLQGFDQFPVKDKDGKVYGVLTATNLLSRLGKNQVSLLHPSS